MRLLLLLPLLLQATSVAAQVPVAEYAARRDSLAAHVGEGVVLAFGARAPVDDQAAFRQLPAFQYLTGFGEVDAAFLMVVRGGRVAQAMLYAPARDARRSLYDGFLPDSAVLLRELGVALRTMEHLRPAVEPLVAGGLPLWYLHDVATRDALRTDSLTRGTSFLRQLAAVQPSLRVRDAHPVLDSLRVPKSAAEQALLRRAIDITMQGFDELFAMVRPGVTELQVQATAEYAWRMRGADGPAFGSIVAAGPNSTSYHHTPGRKVLKAGEVAVLDLGALYHGYAADVTRTVPVSGTWTAEQRAIYQLVRDAQKAGEREMRPGATMDAGHLAVRRVLGQGLAALGLVESPEARFDPPWTVDCNRSPISCQQAFLFMAHGPGHGIGLEVHDAGGYSYSPTGRFQLHEVFTLEPGIYISTTLLDMLPDTPRNRAFIAKVRPVVERYNHIGVRIEDDYVITRDGAEWLSRGPREADEIERAMAARPRT